MTHAGPSNSERIPAGRRVSLLNDGPPRLDPDASARTRDAVASRSRKEPSLLVNAIPSAYREVIGPLIARAREFLEAREPLVPFAFVGNFTTGQMVPVPLGTGDDRSKGAAADGIRRAAAAPQADFVFMVMESWGLPPDKIRRVDEIRGRYGSIGASPYRIDMVSFSLETRHGMWFAQAPLKRKGASKKRRTFGLVEFRHYDDVEGRFADLLGTQPADTQGTGPLH
jgi:hypothetical protein